MSDIKVTQKTIDDLINRSTMDIRTVFGKCTVVCVQLPNGYVLTESSACVDPENYSLKLGTEICIERIKNKLWELEGYMLQNNTLISRTDETIGGRPVPDLLEEFKGYHIE